MEDGFGVTDRVVRVPGCLTSRCGVCYVGGESFISSCILICFGIFEKEDAQIIGVRERIRK